MLEFMHRLEHMGLSNVDDFFAVAFDLPAWCAIRVGLTG